MKSFYTSEKINLFAHVFYGLEQRYQNHVLYATDLMKLIFHYGLYNEQKHTVENAIVQENISVLKFLLETSPAPEPKQTWFSLAASKGNLEIFKYLSTIMEPAEDDMQFLLERAAYGGHFRMVEYLLQRAPMDVFEEDTFYGIIQSAVMSGSLPVVDCLFSNANNRLPDTEIASEFLSIAAKRDHEDIVDYFLSMNIDTDAYEGAALINACREGHFNMVQKLISAGADINIRDGQALHEAAANGYLDIVRYLVDQGIQIVVDVVRDFEDEEEDLHKAVMNSYYDVVQYLAEIDLLNFSKAIDIAACCMDDIEMVEIILDNPGATKYSYMNTLIFLAKDKRQNETIFKLVLEAEKFSSTPEEWRNKSERIANAAALINPFSSLNYYYY